MQPARQFAIGDVHGCLASLKALLYHKIELKPADRIFLVGDYVHRGPDSIGVLEELISLQERGYDIRPIRGNHDVMFLDEEEGLSDRYRNFLESLPYYQETNDFYFVHAELNFDAEDPLADTSAMIWGVGYPVLPDWDFLNGRKVIHGHIITPLSTIFDAIYDEAPIIPLDNGCYKAITEP
ncbi:MAG: metallophosphoesterase, partial [Bacteroidota bacterium]